MPSEQNYEKKQAFCSFINKMISISFELEFNDTPQNIKCSGVSQCAPPSGGFIDVTKNPGCRLNDREWLEQSNK